MSGTTRLSRYQKGKTRKVKTNLDLLEQEIVSGSGICWATCKSAPYPIQPRQHPTTCFLQAGCLSCRPTNSVKALEAVWTKTSICNLPHFQIKSRNFSNKIQIESLKVKSNLSVVKSNRHRRFNHDLNRITIRICPSLPFSEIEHNKQ